MITPEQIHHRLETDLPYLAEHGPLIIKTKKGQLIPFKFNRAQRYIHKRIEEQKQKTGRVRALIIKGRQQGISTYVSARYYQKSSRWRGIAVLILSHEIKTTDQLFMMVKRYQTYINPALRPVEGASNRNQLSFLELESSYVAATAANENSGRGFTVQLLHGSEIAYWQKAQAIQDGAFESVGDVQGSEIILESTGNGPKGLFYQKCLTALAGKGDYILIFIPWFWEDDYERDCPVNEIFTAEEETYRATFLEEYPLVRSSRKLIWRRAKIIEHATAQNPESGLARFRNIYPSTPIEAFQSSGAGLMRPEAILAARKSKITDEFAPLIIGVDPAGASDNADRTIIALRRGRHLERIIKYTRMHPMELVGIIAKLIDTENPDMVFIDRGYGEGTIDRLHELGYGRKVQGVAFAERTLYPGIYSNKRSEIIIELANWINGGGVRIPDDDEIHADFACLPLDRPTSNGLKSMPSKHQLKTALEGQSTDIVDGVGLTFAYPVRRQMDVTKIFRKAGENDRSPIRRKEGPLTSLARSRQRGGR